MMEVYAYSFFDYNIYKHTLCCEIWFDFAELEGVFECSCFASPAAGIASIPLEKHKHRILKICKKTMNFPDKDTLLIKNILKSK